MAVQFIAYRRWKVNIVEMKSPTAIDLDYKCLVARLNPLTNAINYVKYRSKR